MIGDQSSCNLSPQQPERLREQQCELPPSAPALQEDLAAALAAGFAALADPARVKIVHRLLGAGEGPVCVCDLVGLLSLSQPSVSYHLRILRDAGLVERERRGSFAHYRLREDALLKLLEPLLASASSYTPLEAIA
ncbi:MAG TPA: metalloregulator ArsR/SmtB family transcription factor [Solirubrobacteraceae bacterium]|nr:metalloregulator ArsR/SmtB family transcription factor [Solirubrobacteraceae bacterium]